MGALQHIKVPGYSAGVFRRTKVDLQMPEAILARAHAWFRNAVEAGSARWDEGTFTYHFSTEPGRPDASIHFGYVQHEKDLNRYQGAAFQYLFIDELGQWPEKFYRYLFSRLRKTSAINVPLRMRASANPGGQGHAWIKERFVEFSKHIATGADVRSDLRRRRDGVEMPAPRVYVSPPSKEAEEVARETGVKAEGAYFVPSFARDNPGLDQASYRSQLARLMPSEREWFEHGNWDAAASGNFFTLASFDFVDAEPAGVMWLRSWDFAATDADPKKDPDWSVGSKCGFYFPVIEGKRINEPRFVVADVEAFQLAPGGTQERVRQVAARDGRKVRILMEQEPGSAGKTVIHNWQTQSLVGFSVLGMRKTGPKQEYWLPLARFAAQQPILLVRAPWNKRFIDQLTALPIGHDDEADSVSQAFAFLSSGGNALARAQALS